MVKDKDLFGDNKVELTSSVDLEMMDDPVMVPVMVPLPIDSFSLAASEAAVAIAEVKVAVEATEYEPYIDEAVEDKPTDGAWVIPGLCLRLITGVWDKSKVNSMVRPGNSFLKYTSA